MHRNTSRASVPGPVAARPHIQIPDANASSACRAASTGRLRRDDHLMTRCPSLPQLQHRTGTRREASSFAAHPAQRSKQCQAPPRQREQKPCVLRPDATVQIGTLSFHIRSQLGAGSFGCVWAAAHEAFGSVAVKEILCRTSDARDDAQREGMLLRTLAHQMPDALACHIPSLFAIEVVPASMGWQVCLAMSRVPGVPVSKYLKTLQCTKQFSKRHDMCDRIVHACNTARELLAQLAPAFAYISQRVFHRDVNPANILVDEQSCGPHFSVIDFGLATDATTWSNDVGSNCERRLQRCRVVGNGCYWPTSAWLAFTHGAAALSNEEELRLEFAQCLDFHGMGMVALQLLAESLPRSSDEIEAGCHYLLVSKFLALQRSWSRYWQPASATWVRILKSWRCGDIQELRSSLAHCNFHKTVQKDLKSLRTVLKEACQACQAVSVHKNLPEAAVLLSTIREMVSIGQKPCCSPNWRRIQKCLGESKTQLQEDDGDLASTGIFITSAPLVCSKTCNPPSPSTGTPPSSVSVLSVSSDF